MAVVMNKDLVFIFSDQQTFDMLGCYGNQQVKTPNLDRFAKEGIHMYHGHMAMISGVDNAFGTLMNTLGKLELDENTLVVFTSDHGDMLEFDQAIFPKQYPHYYSLHIP